MTDWKESLQGIKEQREEQAELVAERVLQKMLDDGYQVIEPCNFGARIRAEIGGELGTSGIAFSALNKFVEAGKLKYTYHKDHFGAEYGEYRAA